MLEAMILAELHAHSNLSDGKLPLPELIDFYGQRGFQVLAVTDHLAEEKKLIGRVAAYINAALNRENFSDYLRTLQREANRAWREYRMLVLPGVEVSKNSLSNHRSAHVLGIGIQDCVDADADIPEICAQIRAQGGLTVAAHPVSTRKWEKQTYHLWDRRQELAPCFDAWEVASGPHLFPEVLHSGLPVIATSDFHRPEQINAWKTILHCELDPRAVLSAIREQRLSFQFYREKAVQPLGNSPFLPLPAFR